MNDVLLRAEGLWLEYGGERRVTAVRDINLTVHGGEFLALVGPSGSGKSSLLYLLAGLLRATRGRVLFRGAEWPHGGKGEAALRRTALGLVFSEPFLIQYLTVRENALLQTGVDSPPGQVAELADRLGIHHLLDEFPSRLSSGEAQRASVLRALVNRPPLILADEPTAHLDHQTGLQVVDALRECAAGSALVLASHDPRMLGAANRTCRLLDGVLVTGEVP